MEAMSESKITPVFTDDSEIDLEFLDMSEVVDDSIEVPNAALLKFFSNDHVQLGEDIYELDQVESKILEVLRRSKGPVSEETIMESLFGTAEGGASEARQARYHSALASFNGMEQETDSVIYERYIDENDSVIVECLFKSKMIRRPYVVVIDEPENHEQDTPPMVEQTPELNVLDDHNIEVVTLLLQGDTDRAQAISSPASEVFREIIGTSKPSFDDQVQLMQEIKRINEWFESRGLDIEISRGGSLTGPVFRINGNELEYLEGQIEQENILVAEEASQIEMQIREKAEAEERERLRLAEDKVALAEAKKAKKKTERAAKRAGKIAVKAAKKRAPSSNILITLQLRSSFRYRKFISDAETRFLAGAAEDTGIDEKLLFSTRVILGRAYTKGKTVKEEDEETLIRFWQESQNTHQNGRAHNRKISDMSEASFGAMMQRYESLIRKMAWRMSKTEEYYKSLILAGLEGFHDAMEKYDLESEANFRSYFGLRVNGEMIDSIRRENEKPRHAENWQKPLSLDASPLNNTDQNGVTLLDTLPHVDTENTKLMNAIEMPMTEVRSQLLEAMNRVTDSEGRINRVSERDLTIMLMDFGTTHLMTEEQLKLYKELISRRKPHETLRRQIWEHYGITEARISQIVDQSTNRLGNILEPQREELFPE